MVSTCGNTSRRYELAPGKTINPSLTPARSIRILGEQPSKPYPFLSAIGALPSKALAGSSTIQVAALPKGAKVEIEAIVIDTLVYEQQAAHQHGDSCGCGDDCECGEGEEGCSCGENKEGCDCKEGEECQCKEGEACDCKEGETCTDGTCCG